MSPMPSLRRPFALDDRQRWLLDLGPVGDGTAAKKQMSNIEHSEQGTNLDPSLTSSAERLRSSSASLRHIVLFTDGFTDTNKLRALATPAVWCYVRLLM